MDNAIQQALNDHLPSHRRSTTGGWWAFNAVCCHHRGEGQDRKRRGGAIFAADGSVSYHCFNCQFKTSWRPGRGLSLRFRQLLQWLHMPQEQIDRLRLETLKYTQAYTAVTPSAARQFHSCNLPDETRTFEEWGMWINLQLGQTADLPDDLVDAVHYATERGIYSPQLAWCSQKSLRRRLIIPFTYNNKTVGYTARAIDSTVSPKYLTESQPGYVFNMDAQKHNRQFVILCEGPVDALIVDGIATLSNNINAEQTQLISSLQRNIIVVPDFDKHVTRQSKLAWPGGRMLDLAAQQGWAVSFPDWSSDCKDIAQAVNKYGKLFVLKNIIDTAQNSELKIKLMAKKYMKQ
jgi:hypothetical protein